MKSADGDAAGRLPGSLVGHRCQAEEIGAFAQLLFVCPQELVPFSHAEKMNL